MEDLIKAGERVDDLQFKGLRVIQKPEGFCFGIDAVLLANFVKLKKGDRVVELGTGTGVIPILLAGKSVDTRITALEIQEEMAEMATRSVALNKLEERIQILNLDLKEAGRHLPHHQFDVVVSNPPYMPPNGLLNPQDQKAISRHELKCTLEDVIRTAAELLRFQGRCYLIHRPQRLVDILTCCREHLLEPKILQFVHSKATKKPKLLLLECRKHGGPELKLMDPLVIYQESGAYSDELLAYYSRSSLMEGEDELE